MLVCVSLYARCGATADDCILSSFVPAETRHHQPRRPHASRDGDNMCKIARLGLDEVRSLDIFVALRDYTSHLPIVAPKKDKICVCVEDGKRIRNSRHWEHAQIRVERSKTIAGKWPQADANA